MVAAPSLAAVTAMLMLFTNPRMTITFFSSHVSPAVNFRQLGNTPISGNYTSLSEYLAGVVWKMAPYFDDVYNTGKELISVTGGYPQDTAVAEFRAWGTLNECLPDYESQLLETEFVWVMKFDEKGKIKKITHYDDTQRLQEMFTFCSKVKERGIVAPPNHSLSM